MSLPENYVAEEIFIFLSMNDTTMPFANQIVKQYVSNHETVLELNQCLLTVYSNL